MLRPHGLLGAFVVNTKNQEASALETITHLFFDPSTNTALEILRSSFMPKGWLVKVEGVSTEEEVRRFVGKPVFAAREQLPELGRCEFYVGDLVDFSVQSAETGEPIGTFYGVEFSEKGSGHDWWVVTTRDGRLWVPAVPQYIEKVDPAAKVISVRGASTLSL